MSTPATPASRPAVPTALPDAVSALGWADPARAAAFTTWLKSTASAHGLRADTVRAASADASFRRYFRVDANDSGARIVMDAPPLLENSEPFVRITRLMHDAGLRVPEVLTWDAPQGFMLLSDVGTQTMMEGMKRAHAEANRPVYEDAVATLLAWQSASKPDVLPAYDDAVLRREINLFPDWYVAKHRQVTLDAKQTEVMHNAFDLIIRRNLAAPSVYVHRDFMPRNLMLPTVDAPQRPPQQRLAVLDYQDALYGPVTYDIASLMRDAFLTWDEEFVLDITVRYWERARKLGLMDFEDWHSDFGAFWRAVEWMGLQRHLKVAGIFARITLRDGKPKYLADAPRFIAYIRHTCHRYRELGPLLQVIDAIEGETAVSGYAFGRM